jgi:hypothetical protein
MGLSWWCTPVIPRLMGLRQEDHEFEARLSYIVTPCLRKAKRSSTNIIKYIHILWRQILSMVHIDIEMIPFKIQSWTRHGGIHL